MKAAFAVMFALLFLVLPITAGASIFFDKESGKLHFRICLYKKIKLISGYATFGKHKVQLYFKKKKLSFPYKKMLEDRKKFDIFAGFDIAEISALLEIGSANSTATPVVIATVYNTFAGLALNILRNKNTMLSAYNGTEIYEGRDVLKYNFNIAIIFNLLLLIVAVVKKITENIINGKRAKQNRQSDIKRDQEPERIG